MAIPAGYIVGLSRIRPDTTVAHLYKGTFADPGLPMCARGWNRDGGESYSIFRNNVGKRGVCRTCMRRAKAGLPPIGAQPQPTSVEVEVPRG